MRQTLGQQAHYDAHYRRRRPPDLPGLHSASYVSSSSTVRSDWPSPTLLDAIDARAGWLTEAERAAEKRLRSALRKLRLYDRVLVDVLTVTCLRGRWSFALGGGLRHHDWRQAAALIGSGEMEAEEMDRRTVDNWVLRGWEMVGVLLATPAQLAEALRQSERTRWACRQLQEGGLI